MKVKKRMEYGKRGSIWIIGTERMGYAKLRGETRLMIQKGTRKIRELQEKQR